MSRRSLPPIQAPRRKPGDDGGRLVLRVGYHYCPVDERPLRQNIMLCKNKNFRIERASEHLRGTENSVTEIAFACGFEDSNFFAREFRKASGYSPTEYRRHWRI